MSERIFINNQIRAKEVRLIDETGKQTGVMPLHEALKLANERGLDLIQVTERVDPPVCKLGEYGKYLYQRGKKEREIKKHQAGGELKEIRLTFNIGAHDMETRARQAAKFLLKGDQVRISLRLRGRENAMEKFAREKIEHFFEEVQKITPVKKGGEIKKEPRGLSVILNKQ